MKKRGAQLVYAPLVLFEEAELEDDLPRLGQHGRRLVHLAPVDDTNVCVHVRWCRLRIVYSQAPTTHKMRVRVCVCVPPAPRSRRAGR